MANPRYIQPRERTSPRDERLGQLAQLVALQNATSDDRAGAGRQQAVIQLMQMMQQQKAQQQQFGLHERQLGLDERALAFKENEVKQPNPSVLGELAARGDESAAEALGAIFPGYGVARKKRIGAERDKKVAATLPAVQALYKKGGKDLPGQLGAIESTVDPAVWAALPWDRLNASMTPETTQPDVLTRIENWIGQGGQGLLGDMGDVGAVGAAGGAAGPPMQGPPMPGKQLMFGVGPTGAPQIDFAQFWEWLNGRTPEQKAYLDSYETRHPGATH